MMRDMLAGGPSFGAGQSMAVGGEELGMNLRAEMED